MGDDPAHAPSMTTAAQGSIHFLQRLPLYKEEKPYTIRYTLPEDSQIPRTNSQHEEIHGIPIQDIRGHEGEFTLSQNGFVITRLDGMDGMGYDDFTREDFIIEVYLPAVARKLREILGAKHVQVYEHTVCFSPVSRLAHTHPST